LLWQEEKTHLWGCQLWHSSSFAWATILVIVLREMITCISKFIWVESTMTTLNQIVDPI
jgi:hypothetical protein